MQTAILEKTGGLPLLAPKADPYAVAIELSAEELEAFEGFFVAGDPWILEVIDGEWFMGGIAPRFTMEEDVAVVEFMGTRFVRG